MEHRTKVLKLEAEFPVFLFVDEFRKLNEACIKLQQYREQDMFVLRSLGNFLDQPLKHTVMISTLESTALIDNGSFRCCAVCYWEGAGFSIYYYFVFVISNASFSHHSD